MCPPCACCKACLTSCRSSPVLRCSHAGDRSALVDDATIPGGTVLGLGRRFEQIWALQTAGGVPSVGRALVCRVAQVALFETGSGLSLVQPGLQPDPQRLSLSEVAPGGVAQAATWFTASSQPSSAFNDRKMAGANGVLSFPESTGLWVMVKAVGIGAAASAAPYKQW